MYADYIIILAENGEQLQALTDTLSELSLKTGLEINTIKTKAMVFTRGPHEHTAHVSKRNVPLQGVKSYIYFGREVYNHLGQPKEIRKRIEIARSGFMSMRVVLSIVAILYVIPGIVRMQNVDIMCP